MDEFRYVSYAQEVIFASGALARLGEAVERFCWQRLMLCTNHSLRANGHVDKVESILGTRLVAVFDHVQPHVQDIQVAEVLALAMQNNADAVIGMGGGSPIGMAKATGIALEEQRTGNPAQAAFPTDQPLVPIIAIPTTYAGSEMTPVYGITHSKESPPRKVTVNDPKIPPKLVIYDPELTLNLPPEMTASTGTNALAHCIEALYSKTRNPLSTATATSGAQHIFNALLRCYEHGDELEARTEMLLGAHLAGLSLASVSMGLHHGLCHVLGGSASFPHGIANSVILPHAIRFNADETAPLLLPAAEAMGVPVNRINPMVAVEAMVQKIYHLIGQMNLPQHLQDAGVGLREDDLPNLAQLAVQNRTVQNNPKPITDPSQIEQLLMDAW
ncbi:MAG TPA: iron-containing alcohol dehydrogenase [Anaerolineales bacterium]|nr:iron-containing alcohol dehydrogenase [Anaerolineales bacterium]